MIKVCCVSGHFSGWVLECPEGKGGSPGLWQYFGGLVFLELIVSSAQEVLKVVGSAIGNLGFPVELWESGVTFL